MAFIKVSANDYSLYSTRLFMNTSIHHQGFPHFFTNDMESLQSIDYSFSLLLSSRYSVCTGIITVVQTIWVKKSASNIQ